MTEKTIAHHPPTKNIKIRKVLDDLVFFCHTWRKLIVIAAGADITAHAIRPSSKQDCIMIYTTGKELPNRNGTEMLDVVIALLIAVTNASAADVVEAEATIVDQRLAKRAAEWSDAASSEYYIRLPGGRIESGATKRIKFTLPNAGGGQVPCGALVYGLNFRKRSDEPERTSATSSTPQRPLWQDLAGKDADKDIVIGVEIPGSEGPATYKQTVPSESWSKPVFELPVGPGDDVAVDSWQLTIENRSTKQIKYSAAFIRLMIRLD